MDQQSPKSKVSLKYIVFLIGSAIIIVGTLNSPPKGPKYFSKRAPTKLAKPYELAGCEEIQGGDKVTCHIYAKDALTRDERAHTLIKAAKELIGNHKVIQVKLEFLPKRYFKLCQHLAFANYSPEGIGFSTSPLLSQDKNSPSAFIWDVEVTDFQPNELQTKILITLENLNDQYPDLWQKPEEERFAFAAPYIGLNSGEEITEDYPIIIPSEYFYQNGTGEITVNEFQGK